MSTDRAQIPQWARAVALNVTSTAESGAGFVTVWPCNNAFSPGRPNVSSLNYRGPDVANMVIVPLPSSGGVCVKTTGVAGSHVIADVLGYFDD